MKLFRLFHLGRMAQAGELHQRGAGNQLGHLLAQYLVMTNFGLDRRRRHIFADGGSVAGADQQQGGHLQVFELVVHRLGAECGTVYESDRLTPHRPKPEDTETSPCLKQSPTFDSLLRSKPRVAALRDSKQCSLSG